MTTPTDAAKAAVIEAANRVAQQWRLCGAVGQKHIDALVKAASQLSAPPAPDAVGENEKPLRRADILRSLEREVNGDAETSVGSSNAPAAPSVVINGITVGIDDVGYTASGQAFTLAKIDPKNGPWQLEWMEPFTCLRTHMDGRVNAIGSHPKDIVRVIPKASPSGTEEGAAVKHVHETVIPYGSSISDPPTGAVCLCPTCDGHGCFVSSGPDGESDDCYACGGSGWLTMEKIAEHVSKRFEAQGDAETLDAQVREMGGYHPGKPTPSPTPGLREAAERGLAHAERSVRMMQVLAVCEKPDDETAKAERVARTAEHQADVEMIRAALAAEPQGEDSALLEGYESLNAHVQACHDAINEATGASSGLPILDRVKLLLATIASLTAERDRWKEAATTARHCIDSAQERHSVFDTLEVNRSLRQAADVLDEVIDATP